MEGIKAVAAVALAGAVIAGGCGTNRSASASVRGLSVRSRPTQSKVTHPALTAPPAVGTPQRVTSGGATLTVDVLRVIDPLSDSSAALLPGSRAVGVMLRVANHGSGTYDSSATGDVSVAGSSGAATPVFAQRGVCKTPLRDFDNYISPGETRVGCVAFSLPSGTRVLSVRFSPHAKAAGRVSWSVS